MANVSIPVEVVLLAQEALKDFTKFSKEVTGGVATMEGAFKSLKAIASVALVGKGFQEVISAAEDGDNAVRKLNTSMKLAGNFSQEASNSFLELADSIERTSGVQDTVTLGIIAQGQALGFTNAETERLTKASIDVAAVMGTDVNTAFDSLAKTMSGTLPRGLQKLFPELKNMSKEALINGGALQLLGERYAGAGAILNQSFSGALTGIGLAFEQLARGIGNFIVQNPIVIAALNAIKNAVFDAADFVKGLADQFNQLTVGDFVRSLQLVAEAAIGIGIAFKSGVIFESISAGFKVASSSARGFIGSLAQVDIAAAASRVAVLGLKAAVTVLKAALSLGITLALDQALSVFTDFDTIADGVNSKIALLKSIFEQVASLVVSATASLIRFVGKIPKIGGLFNSSDAAKSLDVLSSSLDVNAKKNKTLADSYKSATDTAIEQTSRLGNASIKASDQRKKATQQEIDLLNLQIKQQQEAIVAGVAQSPLKGLFQDLPKQLAELKQKGATDKQIAQTKSLAGVASAIGTFGQVLQGPQGAANMLTQLASLIPGIGGVIGQVLGVLAQGPAAAAGFVTGFIQAIPQIIQNIILSLPAVVEALTNGLIDLPFKISSALLASLPDVIGKLAAQAPIIAVRFSTALSAQAPYIAVQFAVSFVRDGIPAIVRGFIDEFKKAISSLGGLFGGGGGGGFLSGIGQAVTGAVSGIGKIFGFADGGTPIFSGADNILAGFNAKELVVNKTDTQRLSQFLDRALSAQGQATVAGSGPGGQGGPGNMTVVVQVDRSVLAKTILNMGRDGFRMTPA